ncbi:unnamed protein product [Vicia faba]|uniref:Uncharacterized protein n=1 Tax=Vicia faba TaxID=3906 RepID=A0AAV0ZC55_VICFA|nr:unnamed protein product [Vicia faba]
MEKGDFSEMLSRMKVLVDEVVNKKSEIEVEAFSEFGNLVEKLLPILNELSDKSIVLDKLSIRKSLESLENELRRARILTKSLNLRHPVKQIEDMTHDIGRSLGVLLVASLEVSIDFREQIGVLQRQMMNARFDGVSSMTSSPKSEIFANETKTIGEIEEEIIDVSIGDVILQLKNGNDEEFAVSLLRLKEFMRSEKLDGGLINEEATISILFNRLSSCKADNRLSIIQLLRRIAFGNDEKKEKMVEVEFLSTVVKSLTRDSEERREAVGLLLDLSNVQAVRRRIGRIQGCIVMLVAILNGDDSVASHDAGKLLDILSSNNQNALHMAEAGYFRPLVQYLKEGSDMNKILMATALSRLELTDHSKLTLGEDGAIEPLVKMFVTGKLESKLSSLNALQNLSSLNENVQRLIQSGITGSLLQLLFSVTSVLMTLREPASAILARIAQSESILVNEDVAQQMLSLLNLSSPIIQSHLLEALNSMSSHLGASKVRRKMKEKESEKAAAVGILSNLPASDKKVTDILKRANLLPILISILYSNNASKSPSTNSLIESASGVINRFTNSSDKKLQLVSVQHGIIPLLVKLLSTGSPITKSRAANSLTQLSQNSLSLRKSRKSRWLCVQPSANAYCEVHDGYCFVNSTFCLVKAGAVSRLIEILEDKEKEVVEASLVALSTLLQDEIWENGVNSIAKLSGVQAIIKSLEVGDAKVQEKALWMLERIFKIEEHRVKYGESAQVVLIDLAQKSDSRMKSTVAKVLAELELLQDQSSYF